jgi:hypothetical protein
MSKLPSTPSASENGNASSSSTIDTNRINALAARPIGYNAMTRLKYLFGCEGVVWVNPVNASDKGMLGQIAHNIDVYFTTEDYVRDFGFGHTNLVIGDIMTQTLAKYKKAKVSYAVYKNAMAFDKAAWVKRDAAQSQALTAQWEKQRDEALSARKRRELDERVAEKAASHDETSLRKANRVEGMLDDVEMEDGISLAEFEAQFGEPELEEEFAEMDLEVEIEEKRLAKELAGMEIEK